MKFSILIFLAAITLSAEAIAGGRVLIVLSSAQQMILRQGKAVAVGYYLAELSEPLEAITNAGYEFDFATPGGVKPSVDPLSTQRIFHPFDWNSYQRALRLMSQSEKLKHPLDLRSLTESDFRQYIAIFVPGGNAPMVDLVHDQSMARALWHFHREGKPTALLCHGAGVSLSTRSERAWPYLGYHMTVMSDLEEYLIEKTILRGQVPYEFPETAMRKAGGILSIRALAMIPHVVRDRELVTGQNQFASRNFGTVFVEVIREYEDRGRLN